MADVSAIKELKDMQVLIVADNLRPMIINQNRYYADKTMARRAKMTRGESPPAQLSSRSIIMPVANDTNEIDQPFTRPAQLALTTSIPQTPDRPVTRPDLLSALIGEPPSVRAGILVPEDQGAIADLALMGDRTLTLIAAGKVTWSCRLPQLPTRWLSAAGGSGVVYAATAPFIPQSEEESLNAAQLVTDWTNVPLLLDPADALDKSLLNRALIRSLSGVPPRPGTAPLDIAELIGSPMTLATLTTSGLVSPELNSVKLTVGVDDTGTLHLDADCLASRGYHRPLGDLALSEVSAAACLTCGPHPDRPLDAYPSADPVARALAPVIGLVASVSQASTVQVNGWAQVHALYAQAESIVTEYHGSEGPVLSLAAAAVCSLVTKAAEASAEIRSRTGRSLSRAMTLLTDDQAAAAVFNWASTLSAQAPAAVHAALLAGQDLRDVVAVYAPSSPDAADSATSLPVWLDNRPAMWAGPLHWAVSSGSLLPLDPQVSALALLAGVVAYPGSGWCVMALPGPVAQRLHTAGLVHDLGRVELAESWRTARSLLFNLAGRGNAVQLDAILTDLRRLRTS